MIASLELRWLSRHDKDILLPEIVFTADMENAAGSRCCGCYWRPEENEYLIGDKFVPFDRGVIAINTEDPELIRGTIAHEWRHHWQFYHDLLPPAAASWDFGGSNYDAKIRRFFRSRPHEMDALRYQLKHAPDWCSENMAHLTFGGCQ